MNIEKRLYEEAVALIEKRYPVGWEALLLCIQMKGKY